MSNVLLIVFFNRVYVTHPIHLSKYIGDDVM